MKKHIILKIFLFSFISSITLAQSQKDYFTLKGTIHGNYNGYLYLNYNDLKDSCMVTKNQFSFKGKIPVATAFTSSISGENFPLKAALALAAKIKF